MKIERLIVENYRRFINENINLENDVTIVAGPNNSGKTSFITMLDNLLGKKNKKILFTDFPINFQKSIVQKVFSNIEEYLNNKIDEKIFEENLLSLEVKSNLKLIISYDDTDDIGLFSNYFMDLDETQKRFYLKHSFELTNKKFIDSLYASSIMNSYKDGKIDYRALNKILNENIVEKVYYCDSSYNICNEFQISSFKNLFNVIFIKANRPLDDIESDSNHGLTSQMVSIVKGNPTWKANKEQIIASLNENMDEVKKLFTNIALPDIQNHLSDIDKTKGDEKTKVSLQLRADDNSLEKFIADIMEAEYDVEGILLNESSQGLGFSNLIYIHLFLEKFYQTIENNKINLVILEEPESHMHPQMQKRFIDYFIEKQKGLCSQAIISTHSNEVVKEGKISRIRVIRKNNADSFIIELKSIVKIEENDIDEDKEIKEFLSFFFDVGYSEIIFADKAVLYEGDTERFYLQSLINKCDDYLELRKQYISYIQVGGAYGYNYKSLIELLKIKTLIITDIDYEKESIEDEDIRKSVITNATIKHFYKEGEDKDLQCVDDLYKWAATRKNITKDLIYVAFQTDNDYQVRTLEEAMLCKNFGLKINERKKRSEWEKLKKDSKLLFVIPRNKKGENDSCFTIRDILNSLSTSKVDFMQSVVKENKCKELLPSYIKEGLVWLQK